jgi:hypothetical protein
MKTTAVLSTIAISLLFAPAAGAGAATGMPSPFMPPYPDFGPCGQCVRHADDSPRHPHIAGHIVARPHTGAHAIRQARK